MVIDYEKVVPTMEDLKSMETSPTSAMDKRMDEMREMIANLMKSQGTAPSASTPLEDPFLEKKPEEEGEGEHRDESPKKPASTKGKDGKEEYHEVPPGDGTHPTHQFLTLI